MDIFWRLFLSHFIADFTLQTDWINKMKREKTIGVAIHVFIHLIVTYVILIPHLSKIWFSIGGVSLNGYIMVLVICMLHFTVDQMRIYIIKNKIYPDNTISFIVDQLFHLYFIFMFTPFVDVSINFAGEKTIMILSFLVLVSHTATVLVYYIEKDLNGVPFPGFDQKYFMIFERVVMFGLTLIEGSWWTLITLAWVGQLYYMKKKHIIDISGLNFYLSVFISLVLGVVSRYYLYGGI